MSARRTPSALIASPDVIVRQGLRAITRYATPAVAVTEVSTLAEAAEAVAAAPPEVLLLDVGRARSEVFAVLPVLCQGTSVVLITRRRDATFAELARRRGAVGVLVYDDLSEDDLAFAVRATIGQSPGARLVVLPSPVLAHPLIAENGCPGVTPDEVRESLSVRERDVMAQIALGLRNADVAHRLRMSEKTVKNHINRIFAKFQVDTRAQAILLWLGRTGSGDSIA